MRFEEADKKIRSILYLALGNEGKKISANNLGESKSSKFPSKSSGKISVSSIREEDESYV